MKQITLVVLGWLVLSCAAYAASFDCGKAHGIFERFVCSEEVTNTIAPYPLRPALIKLDAEMNVVYQEALTQHFDPAFLRREQRAWIKSRDRCVQYDKSGCFLTGLYQDRIDNLRYDIAHPPKTPEEQANARLLSMGSPPGDNFAVDPHTYQSRGRGSGLCEALVRWINHTTPKGNLPSDNFYSVVLGMPGLEEPAWQELDIQQHMELFAQLAEYENINSFESFVEQQIQLARGGKYRLWMLKENVDGDTKPETIVAYTPKEPTHKTWRTPVIVTDDLREVDKQANINRIRPRGGLMHYKDKPYFIIGIWGDAVHVKGLSTSCQIQNFKPEGNKK